MNHTLKGITLMVLSMAGFAIEDMFIKLAAARIPTGEVLAVMGLGGTFFFAALARIQGRPGLWSRQFLAPAVLARNAGEVVGTGGYILGITLAPLTMASAVFQALPLAVTLGAALFLGEAVGWRRWSAIFAGFLGVLVIIRPGLEGFDPALLWIVVGVAGMTLRDLSTRRAPVAVDTIQIAGWGMAACFVLGLFMLALTGGATVPGRIESLWLLGAMAAGFVSYWALTEATRIAEAGVTTPFRYVRLVFAMIVGWVVFQERPDLWTWAGSVIIVGSGLYAVARERRKRRLSSGAGAR
ncbi:MAG: DMT family transporter [Rubellimicrobium sp.]|nr:DMT family transporter [Rubellimicrobium sp.]